MGPSIEVRPVVSADRDVVLDLAPRLAIGVAKRRDTVAVVAAVRAWLE